MRQNVLFAEYILVYVMLVAVTVAEMFKQYSIDNSLSLLTSGHPARQELHCAEACLAKSNCYGYQYSWSTNYCSLLGCASPYHENETAEVNAYLLHPTNKLLARGKTYEQEITSQELL